MIKHQNIVINGTITKMTLWRAQGDTETTEGRGPLYEIGIFASEDCARRAAKGKGVFGAAGYVESCVCDVVTYSDPVTHETTTRIVSGVEIQYEYEEITDVRKRALEKLTTKEKKALGLA